MAATSSRPSRPRLPRVDWRPTLGERVDELVPGWMEEPMVTPSQVTGAVITIDHFGNLFTNIDAR